MNSNRQKFHSTVFYVASILIAVTLPLNEYQGVRVNSIAIILLIANWLFEGNLKQKINLFFQNKFALLFSALYLINLLGLLYTSDFQEGMREITVKLSLVLMPLIYSTSGKLENKSLKIIALFFSLSTIAVTFALFRDGFVYTFGNLYNPFYITTSNTEILGRVYCSVYLSLAVFILFFYFFDSKKILKISNVLVLLCVMYIIYLQGILIVKMTIAALPVIVLCLLFIYLFHIGKKKLVFFVSIILISGIFAFYKIDDGFRDITNKAFSFQAIKVSEPGIDFEISSFSIRHNIWSAAVKILNTDLNWITGIGTGDVSDRLIQTYDEMKLPSNTYHDPHNEYLSSVLRNGIVGLLIFLAGIFVPLYWSIKNQNYLYTSFLLLSLICMLTESWFSRHSGVVFFSFFNSLFAFHSLSRK